MVSIGVFDGITFCVDGFTQLKKKQEVIGKIKEGGGDCAYTINSKVCNHHYLFYTKIYIFS